MGHPTDTQIMNKLIEIGDNLESKLNELESIPVPHPTSSIFNLDFSL